MNAASTMNLTQFLKHAMAKLKSRTNTAPPFYQTFSPILPLDLVDPLGFINHEKRFVYSRIFKAANNTVVASLYHAERGQKITSRTELRSIKDQHFSRPSTLSITQTTEVQNFYFKFAIVRNPYTRVLSAYLDKVVRHKEGKHDLVADYLGKPTGYEISFGDFLDYLEEGGINQNAHWARQSDLLLFAVEIFDYIGKTENLSTDLPAILREIFERTYPLVSVSDHRTRASKEVIELTTTLKDRIYRLYEIDFDNFGYSRQIE